MAALRIFSYLPNPRIWKATITGRLCGVEVDVRGAPANELSTWLWDFNAQPLAGAAPHILSTAEREGRIGFADRKLYKTDAFLEAQPFGTVPAAFSPDGRIGIFESNSIMRAVARLATNGFPVYGLSSNLVKSFLLIGERVVIVDAGMRGGAVRIVNALQRCGRSPADVSLIVISHSALVLLHYWGGSSRTWQNVIDRLGGWPRAIALDQRRWGVSVATDGRYDLNAMADDAEAVGRTLGLNRYVLVGHSTGDQHSDSRAAKLRMAGPSDHTARYGVIALARRSRLSVLARRSSQ
jgi:hypothetical protein